MKRIMKISVMFLMMMVMMTGLTGCRKFEQMRQNQATLKEDGILVFRDEAYRLLPECEYLNPNYAFSNGLVYLTPEGTPVLLSGFLGNALEISKDKNFIMGTLGSGDQSYTNVATFCHVDKYDEIMDIIEKGYEANGYKCEYYDGGDGMEEYILSDEEIKAVETVLSSAPVVLDEEIMTKSCSIFSCMRETPFSQYEMEFMVIEDEYYLQKYDGETGDSVYYRVPAELNSVFEKIVDICIW